MRRTEVSIHSLHHCHHDHHDHDHHDHDHHEETCEPPRQSAAALPAAPPGSQPTPPRAALANLLNHARHLGDGYGHDAGHLADGEWCLLSLFVTTLMKYLIMVSSLNSNSLCPNCKVAVSDLLTDDYQGLV